MGEEPGWRGFLLLRLRTQFGGEKYIWLLGLAWAVWHYPFTAWFTVSSVAIVLAKQRFSTWRGSNNEGAGYLAPVEKGLPG